MTHSVSTALRNLVVALTCLGVAATTSIGHAQTKEPPPPTKPETPPATPDQKPSKTDPQPVNPGVTPTPPPGLSNPGSLTRPNSRTLGPQKGAAPVEFFSPQRLESAQGMGFWLQHSGVQIDLHVEMTGKPALDAVMTYDTKKHRARIERKDGVTLVYDGAHTWVSPASAAVTDARLQALNWPFFFSAPFRITDPAAVISDSKVIILKGATNDSAVVKHKEGAWASPDDWYRVYVDHDTQFLHAIAYQLAPQPGASEADKSPHAVTFSDYLEMDKMHLAMTWTFWNWNPDWGIRGDSIGTIKLSNVKFIVPTDTMFAKPADAKEEKTPPLKPVEIKPVAVPSSETDRQ